MQPVMDAIREVAGSLQSLSEELHDLMLMQLEPGLSSTSGRVSVLRKLVAQHYNQDADSQFATCMMSGGTFLQANVTAAHIIPRKWPRSLWVSFVNCIMSGYCRPAYWLKGVASLVG